MGSGITCSPFSLLLPHVGPIQTLLFMHPRFMYRSPLSCNDVLYKVMMSVVEVLLLLTGPQFSGFGHCEMFIPDLVTCRPPPSVH